MGATTLHSHMASGVLPPKWYPALREMAREANLPLPREALFSFQKLPEQTATHNPHERTEDAGQAEDAA